MLPGQLALPNLTGPALVVGPVFLCMELTGPPGHKARHRSRLVIPRTAWSTIGNARVITAAGARQIFVTQYPEPKSAAYEKTLAEAARWMMGRRAPTERPVALLVHAFKQVPQSWSQKDRAAALAGAILPTGKPDDDNYLKVRDALNGIVWKDDSQCVDSRVIKRYSASPALRIEVREFLPPEEAHAVPSNPRP